MEINVIEKSKNKLTFDLKGESHTFCNILKNELWNDKNVTVAAYRIKHPLVATPIFSIETSQKTPADALSDAIKRVKKTISAMKKSIAKEL